MMTTHPTPPQPSPRTLLTDGMYHCTGGHYEILYNYVLCDHWIRQLSYSLMATKKKKKTFKNGGQKWLPLVEVSPDPGVPYLPVRQFCLKTHSHHLQSQFIAKATGLQRSAISPPLSGSCFLSQSWLWLALSALSELRYTNTLGVREFKIVWNFLSLSH